MQTLEGGPIWPGLLVMTSNRPLCTGWAVCLWSLSHSPPLWIGSCALATSGAVSSDAHMQRWGWNYNWLSSGEWQSQSNRSPHLILSAGSGHYNISHTSYKRDNGHYTLTKEVAGIYIKAILIPKILKQDRLPKVILNSQPPLNTLLGIRKTRPSSTTGRQTPVPPLQSLDKWWYLLYPPELDTRSKNYNPAACRRETTNRNLDKMRQAKNMLQTKE